MATLAQRVSLILRSSVGDLISKCEDPAKLIDQAIIDEKTKYAKLLNESAEIFGQEKIAKEAYDRQLAKANEEHDYAKKALAAGNEDDAKTLLLKEQEIKKKADVLKTKYDAIHDSAEVIRKSLNKAKANIEGMQAKADEIKAKSQAAKAMNHATDIVAGAKSIAVENDFSRLSEKADKAYAAALGKAEFVKEQSRDVASDSLEAKYVDNTGDDAEELLKALKAEK